MMKLCVAVADALYLRIESDFMATTRKLQI